MRTRPKHGRRLAKGRCGWVVGPLTVCLLLAIGSSPGQQPPQREREKAQRQRQPAGRQLQIGPLRIMRQAAGATDGSALDGAVFAHDRAAVQRLHKAEELLGEERFAESVRLLGGIVQSPQDFFFQPEKNIPVYRSLKTEAQRLIGAMPRAGRETYELTFGAEARQQLDRAVAAGDAAGVAEVSRRYFHTQAGYAATHLLGLDHYDRGRPLAAAMCFERLRSAPSAAQAFEPQLSLLLALCWRRAGQTDRAAATLAEAAQQHGGQRVELGGKATTIPGGQAEALAWLDDVAPDAAAHVGGGDGRSWPMFRGDPARLGKTTGSTPLLAARWRVPTSYEPQVQRLLEQLDTAYKYRELTALCALQPVVVDGRVVVRNAHTLQAIDAVSGKRLWEIPTAAGPDGGLSETAAREQAQFSWALEQRLWDDATYGTLSSDGRLVYCVEDLSSAQNLNVESHLLPPGARGGHGGPLVPRGYNRLAAYDIRSGKLVWELGGAKGDRALPQAGAYFLGPPLPVAGRLYVEAEHNGEIRLGALEADTGREEWSQQLAVVEDGVMQNRLRRAAGAAPSYADGVLVCPTVAGAVVAVDVATRALLWGYQYAEDSAAQRNRMLLGGGRAALAMGGRLGRAGEGPPLEGWVDATATLCDGRVLLTPPETDDLHCLNLMDGSVLWKAPREDSLYLAAATDGKVVLVGRDHVRALSLETGETVWPQRTIKLPSGSLPSGRGFLSGERYYLPLNTAEVLVLDLARGTILAKARSRSGQAPGNLLPIAGAVLSQTAASLDSFPQLEELERQIDQTLSQRPDDPAALAQRGQTRLERGDLAGAIEDLDRAYAQQKDPQTRQLLVDSQLEGLRTDFAAYRARIASLEPLLTQPVEQAAYLRLLAGGLQAQGEFAAAFDSYLKLSDVATEATGLERVDEALSVRRDRWVQAQLGAMVQSAPVEAAAAMNAAVGQRLTAALNSERAEPLRGYLRWFGGLGAAEEARQALASRLSQGESALELELLLWPSLRSSAGAPWAAGQYARLLGDFARPAEAAIAYRHVAADWREQTVFAGRTGQELLDDLPGDSPVRTALAESTDWPAGKVKKRRIRGARSGYQRVGLNLRGGTGLGHRDVQLEWDQARPGMPVAAVDAWGRDLWQLPLIDPQQQVGFDYTPGFNDGQMLGHLLVLSMGRKVWGLDTLGASTTRPPRVLWTREANESLPGVGGGPMLQSQPQKMPWGGEKFVITDGYGQSVAPLGPTTSHYVCLPAGRSVTLVEPLSGQVLWQRQGMMPGAECFGDEELLFCVAPNSVEALVLRALDGRQVATRRVPPPGQRMTALGRRLLIWAEQGDGLEIKLIDAWTGQELWKRKLQAGSKAELLGQEQVAVVEPEGRFWLLDTATGAPVIEAAIEPEPKLTEIFVLRSPDRAMLITNRDWHKDNVFLRPVPGPPDNKVVNGWAYGFDAAGGAKLWQQPLEQQAVLLRQPVNLPLLMFVCHVFERPGGATPRNTNYVNVLALDKRSGRVLHKERYPAPLGNYVLEADRDNHAVHLQLMHESLTFEFTAEPVEEPEANEKPATVDGVGADDDDEADGPAEEDAP